MPRRWRDRVADILAAVEEILAFAGSMDFDTFAADAKTQKAVLADFAIIGEAAAHLPVEITDAYASIPWRDMREMRSVVVHAYFSVEPAIVYDTVSKDLAPLAQALRALLEGEGA